MVLDRASYDWHQLDLATLTTPISVGDWYHLELAVNGCRLTVTATPEGGRPATRIEDTDDVRSPFENSRSAALVVSELL